MLVSQLNMSAKESVLLVAVTGADTPSSTDATADDAELAHELRETPAYDQLPPLRPHGFRANLDEARQVAVGEPILTASDHLERV